MSKTQRLLGQIEHRELVLPEFQREFTWKRDQSRALIDSLLKGYPTGSLLIWRTAQIPALKNMPDFQPNGRVDVLLDGQQRLTTLYMLLKDDIPPYYSRQDISSSMDPRQLYYNLETQELRYYKHIEMGSNPRWVRICNCFKENDIKLNDIAKAIATEDNAEMDVDAYIAVHDHLSRNLDRLRAIENVEYPIMYVKEDADLQHALTVFDRVNSGGTPLSESDIALAHMCSTWPETRRVFKQKLASLKDEGFDFDLTFLVRAMNAVVNCRAEYNVLHNLTEKQITTGWNRLSNFLDFLINFLRDRAYIYGTSDLNTPNVLIPILGYLGLNEDTTLRNDSIKKLLYWMYAALFQVRYSGSVDQRLDRDLTALKSDHPIDTLLAVLREDEGDPVVTAANLDTRGVGHPFYNMSCIVIRAQGAVDWSNGLHLENPIGRSYRIERHHIFPKSVLSEAGYDSGTNLIHRKRVNEIANRVPLTHSTNMDIFNKPPDQYLSRIEADNPGNLKKFMIPLDRELWKVDNYEAFLSERRRLIVHGINDYMENLREHSREDWAALA
jgi:hypothetical protein